MNRVSFRKAVDFIFEVLGQLLEISGVLLGIAGFALASIEAVSGVPLALNDLGVALLVYGTISFLTGALMAKTVQHRQDLEDQFDIALDSGASESHVTYTRPPPRVSDCPACGYTNHDGAIFCIACNSPMWQPETPHGNPPDRSIVERKVKRIVAIHKAKRILGLILLSIAVSSPLLIVLGIDYLAVNTSQLVIQSVYFDSSTGESNGTLLVSWYLRSSTVGGYLTPSDSSGTTYAVTFDGMRREFASCPASFWYSCDLMVFGIDGRNVNGSILGFTMTGVVSFVLYRQQISRSTSTVCDSRCFRFGSTFA